MTSLGRLLLLGLVVLVTGVAFGAGYFAAQQVPTAAVSAEAPQDVHQDFQVFWEVWQHVENDFVDPTKVDPVLLTRGAIRGMLGALEDKHTTYVDPDHYRLERADHQGSFGGIGAQVTIEDGLLTIVEPMPGSPAEEAGIRAGDQIVKIDGEPAGTDITSAVNRIRGPNGETVVLTVLHSGEKTPVDIPIVRGEIENPSVTLEEAAPGIAHLRIHTFGEKTPEEVAEALRHPTVQNANGLVLDLRNNLGGLLDTTVRVTGEFIDQGQVLVQEDQDGQPKIFSDEPGGLATEIPLVVLINGHSASGSEVLAGALRDHGRATLIGEKSFGKGSVTHIYELSDGGAVYITFARWRTPNGTLIEGQCITPDIEVPLTPEIAEKEGDLQLERAIEELRGQTDATA